MIDLKEKQDIARENGSKSHGPITSEGKQRSSLNSITHGLASKCVVLANESQEEYTQLLTRYQNEWQPATITEEHLVIQLANAYWRLRRIWSMETALFDSEMFCHKEDFEAAWSNHHPAMRVVDALTAIQVTNPGTLVTLHRYEIRYQRIHDRSIEQLRKFRRDRHAPKTERKERLEPGNESDMQAQPDRLHSEPAIESADTGATPGWQTRLLTLLLAILSAFRLHPRVGMCPKKARNGRQITNEPTTSCELPNSNFHLPELFAWLSLFTATAARRKVDFTREDPEEPKAA